MSSYRIPYLLSVLDPGTIYSYSQISVTGWTGFNNTVSQSGGVGQGAHSLTDSTPLSPCLLPYLRATTLINRACGLVV